MANHLSTSIRRTSLLSWNSHMSLNRINCDSRCTCFPVELEQQQIAIAPKLMNKSLPTTPRPSPDRERCLIRDLNRKLFENRAKGFLPKRSNPVRRNLCCSVVLPASTTESKLSPELVVSIGRTWNGSKGRSSSVRLSLRRPHYRRHFENALRLAALRPALSLRYALIGESILKERNLMTLPTGVGLNHRVNIRSYSNQPSCHQSRHDRNIPCLKKLTQCDGFLMAIFSANLTQFVASFGPNLSQSGG